MAEVNSVSSYMTLSEASKSNKVTATNGDALGADDFLNLLLIQLKNQNPLEPIDEKEMITQMAQLNSVQELQDMGQSLDEVNHSNQILSGASLIGKMISFLDSSKNIVSTIAESVSIKDDEVYINTPETSILLSEVIEVWKEEADE